MEKWWNNILQRNIEVLGKIYFLVSLGPYQMESALTRD